MLIRRISNRGYNIYVPEMICRLNHLFISPILPEKPCNLQNPYSVLLRIRCFRSSGPAQNPKISLTESTQSPLYLATNRISRHARSDGQDALFDYLHCTRSLDFTDAEYISKNSPHFLQGLLSKIDNEQDVSRALSKFLRYNPINEFEPFLESLGLTPSELLSLLPRSLMYLNDDQLMLDNFHILCGYGIPRSKIGKIYMEAYEVFRYDYGILASKLRIYEELGLSKSTVIKLVCCCPSLLVGGVNEEFVRILEKLKALEFGNDWIGGYLSSRSTYNWSRMLDTIGFLGEVGYCETEMGILFKTNPSLLLEGSGKRIYVLVGRLLKLGLTMNEIYSLFLQNPQILSAKCTNNLWQAMCFLFEIGMEAGDIANIVATNMRLLGSHSLKKPSTVLKKLKVHKDNLCQIIQEDPLSLLKLASKSGINCVEQVSSQNPSNFLDKTTFLLRLGYVENSDEMAKALKQFRGRGDQLQERFDCLVKAGLDCNVVSNMIKQAPSVLNQTKYVLERKVDYLKNCLDYPLESIVAFPSYLCYDMDKINLRFSMYVWLRERSAVKPMLSLSTVLACSDSRFVKYFVDKDRDGPSKWKSLKNSLLSN